MMTIVATGIGNRNNEIAVFTNMPCVYVNIDIY